MQDLGTGKTAIGLNIAEYVSITKKVLFVCLEMSDIQIMQRIISSKSDVNSQFIRNGKIDQEEYKRIGKAPNEISGLNLKIDTKTRTVEELELQCKVLSDKKELDLVIIDYLTLLKSSGKYNSRELEVAEISRKLKILALELKIPVIVLVQLNRDAENKEPTMATIRESGTIEQNCDNIIFLHNPKNDENLVVDVEVILAKQRQGAIGKFYMRFKKQFSRFEDK